jgi:hypothetical protein
MGLYPDTGLHIGMEPNFVCSWRKPNCRSQVIDLSLAALISWFKKSIIVFLNDSNLHVIISTSLLIYIEFKKVIFLYWKKFMKFRTILFLIGQPF